MQQTGDGGSTSHNHGGFPTGGLSYFGSRRPFIVRGIGAVPLATCSFAPIDVLPGNPRSGFIIVDATGQPVAAFDQSRPAG